MTIERDTETVLYRLTRFFEDDFSGSELLTVFFIGLAGNVVCWLVALFAPDFLYDSADVAGHFSDKVDKIFWGIPLLFGATMAFPFFKFLWRKGDRLIVPEDEFMGGYATNLKRNNIRRVFFASLACGGINTIVLSFAVVWFR